MKSHLYSVLNLSRLIAAMAVFAITSSVYLLVAVFVIPWKATRIRLSNRYYRLVGPVLMSILGVRLNQIGAPLAKLGPAIFLINHSSNLDTLAVIGCCPIGSTAIGKKEVIFIPFFGQAYFLSGHLRIDRSNRNATIKDLDRLTKFVIKHSLSIWIAPEGTRSTSGALGPFKKGFVHLAIQTGLPVIPVILHGAFKRMPGKSLRLSPGEMYLETLKPIETSHWSAATVDDHVCDVRNRYLEALSSGPMVH